MVLLVWAVLFCGFVLRCLSWCKTGIWIGGWVSFMVFVLALGLVTWLMSACLVLVLVALLWVLGNFAAFE